MLLKWSDFVSYEQKQGKRQAKLMAEGFDMVTIGWLVLGRPSRGR
jgi:hypothetical protein